MNSRPSKLVFITLAILLLTACAPKAEPTPAVDTIGTRAVELASLMLTQTASAFSPTPLPTFTPEPTATATIEPTVVDIHPPQVRNGPSPCYLRPDKNSALSSNISDGKVVELLAIGKTPGWYKITNPYFNTPCWIQEKDLDLDGQMDLSGFPTE